MTTTAANRSYLASLETRSRWQQAQDEADALAGKFGPRRQIAAMSQVYLNLKAAGKHDAAAAVKAEAMAIRNAAAQQEGN